MNRLKMIWKLTAQAKKQSVSIRRRLMIYWCSLILALCAALVLIFSVTGVFTNHSRKAHDALELQLRNSENQITRHLEPLTAQSVTLSSRISRKMDEVLTARGLEVQDLNDNPKLLRELQEELFAPLNTAMQLSQCSGAYLVLDATTNTASDKADHSATGLYLRFANLNAQGSANQDVVYFRGIPEIARQEHLQLHNRWNLEFDTDLFPGYERWMETDVDRLADACRWSDRFRLPDTWEDVFLLCTPVLDRSGAVCGLCGVELSSLYCYLSYPELNSNFGPMVTVLAPMNQDRLILGQGMTGGAEGTFLGDCESLKVERGEHFNSYSADGEQYIGLHRDTAFRSGDGTPLVAAVLIPRSTYEANTRPNVLTIVVISLSLLTLLVVLSLFLSRRFVKPIVETLEAIESEKDLDGAKTGISELDSLMNFISERAESQPIQVGSLPPDIEELFQNFARRAKTLSAAERNILKYYIDGREISEIPDLAFISIHTVKKHNSNIYQKLGISSRDELMLYIELFRRCDRLNELTEIS